MSVDDRARRASREVDDHYAGSDPRPPVVGGPPRRGRSLAVVLVAVLAAVAVGAVLLRDGGGGEPVRAGPGQGTVRTTTSTTTSTTAVPGDAAPSEPHQPDGVTAPRSVRGDRTVFRVTDVSGETYLVDLPASTPGADRATVVASVYVGPTGPAPVGDEPGMYLGAALFEQPAAVIAPDEPAPGWTPVPGPQRTLEGGALLTQWEQVGPSSPQRFPLELSTIEREGWTLALDGPGQDAAPRVADALVWTRDEDGFHRLSSRDPGLTIGPSPVEPFTLRLGPPDAPVLTIEAARGCEVLDTFDFAIGNFGRWSCLGDHRVQVEGAGADEVLSTMAVRPG